MTIPTRADIETILSATPVAVSKRARTKSKKIARNVKRKSAVKTRLDIILADQPVLREKILDDLESYKGWEREIDDA